MVYFDFMSTLGSLVHTCMLADVDCIHSFTVLHQTFSSFLPFQTWPPRFSSSHWPPLSFPTNTNAEQNYVTIQVWVTLSLSFQPRWTPSTPSPPSLCLPSWRTWGLLSGPWTPCVWSPAESAGWRQRRLGLSSGWVAWICLSGPGLWCSGPWSAAGLFKSFILCYSYYWAIWFLYEYDVMFLYNTTVLPD